MPKVILSLIVSYLLGAIPFAYLLGKIFKRIDIRKLGSGNVGATNAFRVLGPAFGIPALILDIAKGFVCSTLIADFAHANELNWGLSLRVILGVTAVLGHNWTIFLKFRGGKGVATSLGVILGLALIVSSLRLALFFTILGWGIIFFFSGFVSLASITSAVLFSVFIFFLKSPPELCILGLILSSFIVIRHNHNIIKLLQKKEHRFNVLKSFQKSPPSAKK